MISLKKSVTLIVSEFLNVSFMHVAQGHTVILKHMEPQEVILFRNIHELNYFRKKGSRHRFLSAFLLLFMVVILQKRFVIHADLPLNFIPRMEIGIWLGII